MGQIGYKGGGGSLPQRRRTFYAPTCRTLTMPEPSTPPVPSPDLLDGWRRMVAPFTKASSGRALFQLLDTGLPFLLTMAAILFGVEKGFWWALVLIPVGAFLLLRLFMIQHDCGHGSFFPSRWANDTLGGILGLLTVTPYRAWRTDHAVHHASNGNLDRRGNGDVTTLTVKEYTASSARARLGYRLYRNPVVMFGIGPIWYFLIKQRVPSGDPRRHWRLWLSVVGTDLGLLAGGAVLVATLGIVPLLLGWLPVVVLAGSIGIWLFYVQHQFEDAYWQDTQNWNFVAAAMQGSSFYDLPDPLHWLTANIGFHHIHHLSSRIPNYRLRDCHEANPAFQDVPRLSMRESVRCVRLTLWDEVSKKLVTFSQAKACGYTSVISLGAEPRNRRPLFFGPRLRPVVASRSHEDGSR